ncbi:putative mediator of RNA polymerase II transcription subunit 24 [Musca vetustissima]|uniref:putative mediator of RNA polymerase II transcription subunit 24 n=1 Tax=Musca vetustissima TaxID=27455 RepID=UPI002AB6CEAB|nr:putative mediator of RNA polymerase II transcription subunit 24 [Musca vetustissima]
MNSDPAPGRSPGPPVQTAAAAIVVATTPIVEAEQQQKDVNNVENDGNHNSNHNNNNKFTYNNNSEDIKDNNNEDASIGISNETIPLEGQQHSSNVDNINSNEAKGHHEDIASITTSASQEQHEEEEQEIQQTETINFPLTKTHNDKNTENEHARKLDANANNGEAPFNPIGGEYSLPSPQLTTTYVSAEKPLTQHGKSFDNDQNSQMKQEEHETPMSMSNSEQMSVPHNEKENFEKSSPPTSTTSATINSCRSQLDNFLSDATVIDADVIADDDTATSKNVNNNHNASNNNTKFNVPLAAPHHQAMQIALNLHHDIFDTSNDFGINCGLLYKVHLTVTPQKRSSTSATLKRPASKRSQKTVTPEMQNPAIHYTGDFYVETVSLLNAHERGSFVSETVTAAGGGNKLPISWFATAQQNGKRQPAVMTKNAKGSMMGGGNGKKASPREEFAETLHKNDFNFAKVRNASKLKREREQQHQAKNLHQSQVDADSNARWYYDKKELPSSSSSSVNSKDLCLSVVSCTVQ